MDWITGEKFKALGVNFAPERKQPGDYDGIVNRFNVLKNEVNYIYTHTIYIRELIETIKDINEVFVLITHNGDVNVNFPVPNNVLTWWTQNVASEDPRMQSLPIGLENEMWFKEIRKKEKMLAKMQELHRDIYELTGNLLYMNFNVGTNPAKRTEPYRILKDKTWTTTRMGENGHDFDGYLDGIYNHKFVLCPEGNGMDTHRTWETLYMGSIPVEKINTNNKFYADLPICFVEDWDQVTEKFLELEYTRIKNLIWNHSKLEFSYWKNRIHDSATKSI
jgi:hypothetical protein